MRSDQVIPYMEVAIGDVEETVSNIDVESFPGQREEISEEGHLTSFSYDDDDDDIEIQSILVENQVEVFEVETMVTDVRNVQSTSPGGLDDGMQIHDSAQDVPYVTTDRSFITHDADNTHNAFHPHTLPAAFTPDADGYFVQPGSPMMDRCGSVDFDVTPAQENFPHNPDYGGALPTIIQLPGTPQKVLSPGGTPRLGPTPVSITVDPVILKVLKTNPALFSSPATVSTFREQEKPNLFTSVAEDANGNASPSSKSIVNTVLVEEESTSTAVEEHSLDIDLPSLPVEPPVDKPIGEPIANKIPSLASLQTLFSVNTTQGKPTLPTLFDDPYPYSLSTPGPPNEDEESDEESTLHEKSTSTTSSSVAEKSSSSSAARGNKQEDDHYDADNVKDYPLPLETAMSIRSMMASASSGGGGQGEGCDEKRPTDVEAEIDEINEALVDGLDTNTDSDSDGKTDQEFVDAQEENVEEKGDEGVLSTSHEDTSDAVDAHIIVNEDFVERPTNQESKQFKVWSNEGVAGKMGKVFNRPAPEEEKDPFKLMGNGSLVAPKEVEEPDTKGSKFEDEDGIKFITLP